MKTVKELTKYQIENYMKSSKIVMPLVLMLVFLYMNYSVSPLKIVNSFSYSMICIFVVMVWVGMVGGTIENPVSEQILILKSGSERKYYLSNVIVLFLVGIAFSLLAVLFPVLQNSLTGFGLFQRSITVSDVLTAFLIFCFTAFVGGSVGAVFHSRIISDRRVALILALLFVILGIAKGGISLKFPAFKWIAWIFPPLSELIGTFSMSDFYEISKVMYILIHLSVYGIVLTGIRIYLLIKNKF